MALSGMADFHRPRIMGIINSTPDSFYTGSRCMELSKIVKTAQTMVADGADIIDIGGESTRPGAISIEEGEQISRVVPAIKMLRACSSVDISIDTQNAVVAEAALDAGATIINDISALRSDSRMIVLAAERNVPVILMHMKGTPATMQNNPGYSNVVQEVREFFLQSIRRGIAGGIDPSQIILDPGIGFGKRPKDNVILLKHLSRLKIDEFPVLVGLSRKSFLGLILNHDDQKTACRKSLETDKTTDSHHSRGPEDRLMGTLAAHAWCLTQGVDILRVHDVKETRDLLAVWEAVEWAS